MPDLSAYINFSVVLDRSTPTAQIRLQDTGTYPAGVIPSITGIFTILQPDGISTSGSFGSPDVIYSGGALTVAQKTLRLSAVNSFQNGGYSITYTVRAPGYTDTVLTKVFTLSYTAPILVLTPNMDSFTPDLQVSDGTSYVIAALTLLSTTRSWSALIRSVLGTNQTIIGNQPTFDLNYQGSYYDSYYDVTLTSTLSWQLTAINPFVTVIDKLTNTATYQAQIPPSLTTLLNSLTTLKAQLDAKVTSTGDYANLLSNYNLAEAIYIHLIYRGKISALSGLSDYVWQLQKIFNNNTIPAYTNTNAQILPYDWGIGNPTWASISGKPTTTRFAWTVGQAGFPGVGATSFSDNTLSNFNIRMWRGGLLQLPFNPGTGNTYFTKVLASNTVNFPALTINEEIIIETIPS